MSWLDDVCFAPPFPFALCANVLPRATGGGLYLVPRGWRGDILFLMFFRRSARNTLRTEIYRLLLRRGLSPVPEHGAAADQTNSAVTQYLRTVSIAFTQDARESYVSPVHITLFFALRSL